MLIGHATIKKRLDEPLSLARSADFVTNSKALSAASMPDFIAVCVPLIFGTLRKPGLHPAKQPPGNESFGTDYPERY